MDPKKPNPWLKSPNIQGNSKANASDDTSQKKQPVLTPQPARGVPVRTASAPPAAQNGVPPPSASYTPFVPGSYQQSAQNSNMSTTARQFVPRGVPQQMHPYYGMQGYPMQHGYGQGMPYTPHAQGYAPSQQNYMPPQKIFKPPQQANPGTPQNRPAPRERKVLEIIDPKTNKKVVPTKIVPSRSAASSVSESKVGTPPKDSKLKATSSEFSPVHAPQGIVFGSLGLSENKSPMHSSKVNSPKKQFNSPKAQNYSPKSQFDTFKPRANSPKHISNSPKHAVNSPKHAVNSPKHAVNSPKHSVNSPKRAVNSPNHQAASTKFGTHSPKNTMKSPTSQNVPSPKKFGRTTAQESQKSGFKKDQVGKSNDVPSGGKRRESAEKIVTKEAKKVPDCNLIAEIKNGKKVYSIALLLSVRSMYNELPQNAKGWETMTIVADTDGKGGSWERSHQQARGGSHRGGNHNEWQRSQDVPKRASSRGGKNNRGSKREESLEPPVEPLVKTENRWHTENQASSLEISIKAVQSIMNKMTREKFDRLSKQLSEVKMESIKMLTTVISLIFDKAIEEPHFCDMYADLCTTLDKVWKYWDFVPIVQANEKYFWTVLGEEMPPVSGPYDSIDDALKNASNKDASAPPSSGLTCRKAIADDDNLILAWEAKEKSGQYYVSCELRKDLAEDRPLQGPFSSEDEAQAKSVLFTGFKRLLLNNCQTEFSKGSNFAEVEAKVEAAKNDPSVTPEELADMEEKRGKMKRRMLGNIRFIGELYKKHMLQERIMLSCIQELLACKWEVDEKNGIIGINALRPDSTPDEENLESLGKLITTIGSTLEKKCSHPLDIAFQQLKSLSDDKRISIRLRFMLKDVIDLRRSHWKPRRKELKQKTLEEIRKDAKAEEDQQNRQAAAAARNDNRNGPRGSGRNNSYGHSYKERGNSGRSGHRNDGNNSYHPRDRQNDHSFASRGGATHGQSHRGPPPSNNAYPPKSVSKSAPTALEDINSTELAKEIKEIVSEYSRIRVYEEAQACFLQLKKRTAKAATEFCGQAIVQSMESKQVLREALLELLEKLYKSKDISGSDICHGLSCVMESILDLKYDVPKCHVYMGTYLSTFIFLNATTLNEFLFLSENKNSGAWKDIIGDGMLAKIVAQTVSLISDPAIARKDLSNMNASLCTILPASLDFTDSNVCCGYQDLQNWISVNKIEESVGLHNAIEIAQRTEQGASADEIITWIEANVSHEERACNFFAQVAFLFILHDCKQSMPSERHCILLRGICGDLSGELSSLYGLQQCYKAENLKEIFQYLFKEHVISLPAFKQWKKSERKGMRGRNQALKLAGGMIDSLR